MSTTTHWDDHGVASLVQSRTTSATLPVILCAPHGGNAVDGDQSETLLERSPVSPSTPGGGGGSGRGVSLVADVGTSQLLEEIDRRLVRKCSGDVAGFATATDAAAAVVARFHRKYVDANRSLRDEKAVAVHPSCARGRDVHNFYHYTIETAVISLASRFCQEGAPSSDSMGGDGGAKHEKHEKEIRLLLLDVHGQCKFPDKLLIGTCNGTTADLQKLNRPETGFLWHLRRTLSVEDAATRDNGAQDGVGSTQCDEEERKGRSNGEDDKRVDRSRREKEEEGGVATQVDAVGVLPRPGENEVRGYTGGYTVQRHGILARKAEAPAPGEGTMRVAVDAIQLEFGSRLRRAPDARGVTAEAVASAVFRYLQQQQQRPAKSSSSA